MEPVLTLAGSEVTVLEIVIGLLLLLLGALLAILFRRKDSAMQAELMAMRGQQAELHGRLAQLSEEQAQRGQRFQQSLDTRLSDMSDRLGRNLHEQSERSAHHLKSLYERLEVIDRAQVNIQTLAGEVSGLQSILSNKQSRGAFGEMQMQSLIEQFLPARSYTFQATLSNQKRVDALIHLPGEMLDVAVDAKFPLEAWQRFVEAENSDVEVAARKQFARDCLTHIRAIAERYLLRGETHETALLFLPSEAIYAELHARHQNVIEKAFHARVIIVSPTTFMATLHTMNAVMKDAAMREQTHLILDEVSKLLKDTTRLGERVIKARNQFHTLGKTLGEIETSTDKISRKAAKIDTMDLDETDGADTSDALPLQAANSPQALP